MEEEEYLLWLCSIDGFYSHSQGAVIDYFGSAEKAFHVDEKEYEPWKKLRLAWVPRLLASRTGAFIKEQQRKLSRNGIRFISRKSPCFPQKLRWVEDAPLGIFVRGALPDPLRPSVAVVGARSCSSYGYAIARQTGRSLAASGIQVISGMARGVDGTAQEEAVRFEKMSFAVTGCGADICYPASNRRLYDDLVEHGGIISEFPPGSAPLRIHFPMRNRIISGLADKLIVVEARDRSGSLITADCALSQGKDVYAVPGRTDDPLSRGCNHLIADGAYIVESTEELVRSLTEVFPIGPGFHEQQVILAPSEKLVYSNLDFSAKSTDVLLQQTGMAPGPLSEALLQLEMRGLVTEISRNAYARKQ